MSANVMTHTIETEIAAFDRMKASLEQHHMGKWVVIYREKLEGAFDTIDNAAQFAGSKFGRGPYLIRQIGAPPATLPVSVFLRLNAA